MNNLCRRTLQLPARVPNLFICSRRVLPPYRYVVSRRFTTSNEGQTLYRQKRTVLGAVLVANVAVFGTWLYAKNKPDAPLVRSLYRNFTLSRQAINDGRYWTLITSGFSHIGLFHILANMLTLNAFSTVLLWNPAVSAIQFAVLIGGGAIASSIAYMYHSKSEGSDRNALGASGIVSAVGATAACLNPTASFLIFGIVPAPLWALVGGFALLDTYYLNAPGNVGHSGHIGGFLFGIVYYLVGIRTGLGRRF